MKLLGSSLRKVGVVWRGGGCRWRIGRTAAGAGRGTHATSPSRRSTGRSCSRRRSALTRGGARTSSGRCRTSSRYSTGAVASRPSSTPCRYAPPLPRMLCVALAAARGSNDPSRQGVNRACRICHDSADLKNGIIVSQKRARTWKMFLPAVRHCGDQRQCRVHYICSSMCACMARTDRRRRRRSSLPLMRTRACPGALH